MNCNIIKDLCPSYIDGICSEDTSRVVEEHIHHCEECRLYLEVMEQPTNTILPEEVMAAKAPFKRINKKRRIQVFISILLTFMLTIIGYQVVQDVGVVHDYFFPKNMTIVNVTDDKEEWNAVNFGNEEYFKFDSIFWNKEIVNDANNDSEVLLRIKDANGHVIVDEFHISPGKSKKLEGLKKNVNYYLEIKVKKGQFFINVV
ncbi:zf-HC2 domain-containing protein [Lysinibacillus sp. NPDC093688]|uniref:zf-HC2 domain-containing protein n=1 Tax=Lysinibacillus sp. NPDC093688 TaxID=3390577 RepID=UPI003D04D3AC